MKKIINSIAFLTVTSLVYLSCHKANSSLIAGQNLYDNFVKATVAAQQTFTVDATTGGTITCLRGSKITFPPNAFANPDNTITTGSVQVIVKEALDKSQWLMEGLSTTTQTGMLYSGGMLDILVKRMNDGVDVKPSPAMLVISQSLVNVIKVEVPKVRALPDSVGLFLPGAVGVTSAVAPTSWIAAYYPFGGGINSYIFQIPQFRWINCDGLSNQPGTKTSIKVTPDLTNITGATGVQAILVYRNISTVITLQPAGTFMQSYPNTIPVGSTADIICIGKDATGKIIFKVLPSITITALINISIKPEITDAATVTAYLNSIN